jgi:hypothetical protein
MTAAAILATALGGDRLPRQAVAKIRRWSPHRNQAPTILGYLDAELPIGMILDGRKPMRGPTGKHWIAWLTVCWLLIGSVR